MIRTLPAHTGASVTVGRAAPGRVQVAWFFPKVNTPNCTIQAQRLVASWAELTGRGADIVGVSFDSIPALSAWAQKIAAPFPLCSATLADADALGAGRDPADPWREAVPLRVALIADDRGAVLAHWQVGDVDSFVQQVESALNVRGGPS